MIPQTSLDYVPPFTPNETLVYFVRHGQTQWNVEHRFQGQLDVPLSELGEEQAERLGEWLSKLPLRFSAIYTSDLRRSSATVEPVGRRIGIRPTLVTCLRELDCGEWQRLSTTEVGARFPGQLHEWHTHIASYRLPGGESISELQARVYECYMHLIREHRGEAVIIASHGAALAALIAALNNWDLQETWDTRRARMGNTAFSIVASDPLAGTHRTILINASPHLEKATGMESVMDPVQNGEAV